MREHPIGDVRPGHDQRSGEECEHADDKCDPTRAEASADGEDGSHDGCDDQRAEPPERRGEEACPLGIRQLEEIDERQPDPLEQRIDAPIERDAPAWITGLDEVEHEPERPGCETRRSGSRKRPPARPRLAREHERGEDR